MEYGTAMDGHRQESVQRHYEARLAAEAHAQNLSDELAMMRNQLDMELQRSRAELRRRLENSVGEELSLMS